jgi:hypothetical protein
MAMIVLAFQPDEAAIGEDAAAAPENARAAVIEEMYFVLPTRFQVTGVDLLEYPGVYPAWRPLPLLGFAPGLRRVTTAIDDGQTDGIALRDGGVLFVARDGAQVRLWSSLAPDSSVAVAHAELAIETAQFGSEVCRFIAAAVPLMEEHSAWRTWCPGPHG